MSSVREPIVTLVPVRDLRPTQITVGFREVEFMRSRWRARSRKGDEEFLGRHMVPVVLGPRQRHYIVDRHHLCRALLEEGQSDVLVTVAARLDRLDRKSFWSVLDSHGWMHPFNQKGHRRPYREIPKSVDGLVDDPFRSLAGGLRRAGGFAKDTSPFSEFLWADFLRAKIAAKHVEQDFTGALKKALQLAKSLDADYLPGWCGPVVDD
jgi:hypothetical protein